MVSPEGLLPTPEAPECAALECANCGQPEAPAICSRCRRVRYCGPECQTKDWRNGHKQRCFNSVTSSLSRVTGLPPSSSEATKSSSSTSPPPFQEPPRRCPQALLGQSLPRLTCLDSREAQEMLADGDAFVAPMAGLLSDRLLKWDFQYLREHLPASQKYGVMLDEGSGKIVMSHTARNGKRQVDVSASQEPQEPQRTEVLPTSDQARMTFEEFLLEAEAHKRNRGKKKLPYFGLHLLWRFKPEENGYLGEIDEEMQSDLWSIRFDKMKAWQEANLLPRVQRFYLFAGLGGTLYHCHYDLQPNIHVQLTGRKRFILFPPEDWKHLYPFPVHHDLDRRSMVDLDSPSDADFPNWRGARGSEVVLEPGDALYIPAFWWHHVQSLTPETTSMAMWFFETFPLSRGVVFGVGPRAREISLLRDFEEHVGGFFPISLGEEDCTKPRPIKASQVKAFMQWLQAEIGGCPNQSPGHGLMKDLQLPRSKAKASCLEFLKIAIEAWDDVPCAEDQARVFLSRLLDRRF